MTEVEKAERGPSWIAYGDLMRVYACIAVVTLHACSWILVYRGNGASEIWSLNNMLRAVFRWAVPVFIMLSGAIFLAGEKSEPDAVFLRKRLRRVGIPLVFWTAIYLAYIHGPRQAPLDPVRDFYAILKGQPYYHLYFLFVMLGLYLITPALKTVIRHASPKEFKTYLIIILVITSASAILNKIAGGKDPNAFSFFVPFIGFYLAGYQLRRVMLSKTGTLFALAAFLACAVVTIYEPRILPLIPGIKKPETFDLIFTYGNPATIIMSLCAYLILSNPPLNRLIAPENSAQSNPTLRLIAKSTFGVYLIHPLVLEPITFIYFRVFPGVLPQYQEIPVFVFVTLMLSFLIILPLTQIPFLKNLVS